MNHKTPRTSSLELLAAVNAGDPEAVSRALASGADPNAIDDRGWPILFLALDNRSSAIVEVLLDHRADPLALFQGVSTPLIATLRGDSRSLSLLVARGADVNRPDPEGDVPLKVAAAKGDLAMARALLDAGADIEYAGGPDEQSVLGSAVARGQTEMVKLLLDWGADPIRPDVMHQLPVDRLGDEIDPDRRQAITELLNRYSCGR